ncbi:MAG: glycoside-pentoside-hexuronide (GPH):cation symporter [Butyrivibrio sp.]|uniref:glycoside-pentoside-hexuronide (GPH):cation symporter n=1 Tax=Butyrivibrio sp. TaxID=28121 RepID=UPI0025FADC2B|nr:glycoside-pentoside-hexuronide (GPH):cation symporter [Butyrivibrio sp.]MCR5771964.1 glycoside-pentoside-hexuronide (GPH):cation symporter [Butyrivibrio sp.]
MDNKKLSTVEKAGYGLGAVGKDMVYMLSASYVLYYFQDVMGVNAFAMGVILLVARVFDAFNDPIMGVIVAKTKTRWGKFRPWLMIGTLTNAVILFLMFSCPPTLDSKGLVAWAAVFYIVWGVTYTMMDIPYWSMIPAFTEGGKEREGLTTLARSCAGVGSAITTIFTMKLVQSLGSAFATSDNAKEIERVGFMVFSGIVAVLFVVLIVITCVTIKEKSTVDMKTASIGEMFSALLKNDQAMAAVITIVLVNSALYITSNLVIYFFKYDLGGETWYNDYTLFNMVGGASQILAMMLLFPFLRKFMSSIKIFYVSIGMSLIGYVIILAVAMAGVRIAPVYLIPGVLVMAASGVNNVLITIFLANTVDYGLVKLGRSDESVIFSMQTFVVKLASGIAAFIASLSLGILNLSEGTAITQEEQTVDFSAGVAASSRMGLRMVMTLIPIMLLVIAYVWFRQNYILTDEKMEEINIKKKSM